MGFTEGNKGVNLEVQGLSHARMNRPLPPFLRCRKLRR